MGSIAKLGILTADSVDKLRVVATSGSGAHDVWYRSFDYLVSEYGLGLFESEYRLDTSYGLRMRTEGEPDRELDAANASRVIKALPTLTHADATDERLWVTLALREYKNYLLERWPLMGSGVSGHLMLHVFVATARGRERDHAIARLWWAGQYVKRFASDDSVKALRALFANSDLSVQLLGRPNLAAVPSVARAMLRVCANLFVEREIEYSRRAFRDFMQELDFVAGRRVLGLLSEDELEREMESRLREYLRSTSGV